jgi:cytochrome P450
MVSEIMTNGMTMAFSDYNDRSAFIPCRLIDIDRHLRWRRMRRATNDGFSVRACERYQPQQWREAARNVIDMINAPEKWVENIQQ